MNNFRRQQLRGFPVTFLTFLLLLVAVAFSVIGYAASDGTKQQLEAVESRYTTIGAMTDQNSSIMEHGGTDLIHTGYGPGLQEWVWVYKNYERQPDGSIVWDDGTVYHSSNVLEAVAKEAPQIRTISRSGILSAHVDGIYGVTAGAQNYLQYNRVFDNYGYNMAVMVIDELHYYEDPNDDYGSWFAHTPIQHPDGYRTYLNNSLCVGATELVSVHPRYEKLLGRNRFSGNDWDSIWLLNNVEERPFKNGKRYIVRGFLDSITIVQKELDVAGVKTYTYGFYSDDVRMQYYYRPEVSGTITFLHRSRSGSPFPECSAAADPVCGCLCGDGDPVLLFEFQANDSRSLRHAADGPAPCQALVADGSRQCSLDPSGRGRGRMGRYVFLRLCDRAILPGKYHSRPAIRTAHGSDPGRWIERSVHAGSHSGSIAPNYEKAVSP